MAQGRSGQSVFNVGLAAVSCAIVGFLAVSSGAQAQTTTAQIQNLQIGERDDQTRIAVFCAGQCSIERRANDAFWLKNGADSFELDLSSEDARIFGMAARPGNGGSLLKVKASQPIARSQSKTCRLAGREAVCLDFFFDPAAPTVPADQAGVSSPAQLSEPAPVRPSLRGAVSPEKENADLEPATVTSPEPVAAPTRLRGSSKSSASLHKPTTNSSTTPSLRGSSAPRASNEKRLSLTTPQRLSPSIQSSAQKPMLAKVQPVVAPTNAEFTGSQSALSASIPALRTQNTALSSATTPSAPAPILSFADRADIMLDKKLSPIHCEQARNALQVDPWNLDAMVDVGFCTGVDGDLENADKMLARLLQYTPDNYEALVGRGLIAIAADEKGAALRYFQEALNAPPPIVQSQRIIAVMEEIG